MAEVIGVVASIVGIVAAAGKVAELLGAATPILTSLSPNAVQLISELSQLNLILPSLERLVSNLNQIPQSRTDLVQLDDLVVVLTDGVQLLSELESLLVSLGPPAENLRSRLKWNRKEKELGAYYRRLCSLKASMSLLLNILQSGSDAEASQSQKKLSEMTAKMLESNRDLAMRLANLESRLVNYGITHSSAHSMSSTDTIRPTAPVQENQLQLTSQIIQYAFEADLHESRPYRQVRRDTMDAFSFRSSILRSHAWTALSGISLSNTSIIAVIALPLRSGEIKNIYHYPSTKRSEQGEASNAEYSHHMPTVVQDSRDTAALDDKYTIVVLGASNVNKTAAVMQLVHTAYTEKYDSEENSEYISILMIDDRPCEIRTIDTSIHDISDVGRDAMVQRGDGFLIMFNTRSQASFDSVLDLEQYLFRRFDRDDLPVVVLADCRSGEDGPIEVSTGDAENHVHLFGGRVIEIDSKTGRNVSEAFSNVVREIRKQANEEVPQPPSVQREITMDRTQKRRTWARLRAKRLPTSKSKISLDTIASSSLEITGNSDLTLVDSGVNTLQNESSNALLRWHETQRIEGEVRNRQEQIQAIDRDIVAMKWLLQELEIGERIEASIGGYMMYLSNGLNKEAMRKTGTQAPALATTTPGARSFKLPVHRAVLEYERIMPDELPLQKGQFIRIDKHYEDGWVLCTRLDDAERGVVPRGCLSKDPVQPISGGSPNGHPEIIEFTPSENSGLIPTRDGQEYITASIDWDFDIVD